MQEQSKEIKDLNNNPPRGEVGFAPLSDIKLVGITNQPNTFTPLPLL